jgi:hypothetical protein
LAPAVNVFVIQKQFSLECAIIDKGKKEQQMTL